MQVRDYAASDTDAVVRFGLEAWTPVFASMRAQIGDRVFDALYTDWRSEQDAAIRAVLADEANTTWVAAEDAGPPVGFVSATVHEGGFGEIVMIAVAPGAQRCGLGARLTETALTWLREQEVRVAMVETGGDPGHGPARATYARTGFTLMPIARYFQVL